MINSLANKIYLRRCDSSTCCFAASRDEIFSIVSCAIVCIGENLRDKRQHYANINRMNNSIRVIIERGRENRHFDIRISNFDLKFTPSTLFFSILTFSACKVQVWKQNFA